MSPFIEYYDVIITVWAAITTIAAVTPTDKDDKVVARIRNLISVIRGRR